MEKRYGHDQVCSVGTYTALQLRAAIKDVARYYNINFGEVNIATSFLETSDKTIEDLFKKACKIKRLKEFINKYPQVIHDIQLLLGQPKAKSIHACAMMVFPKDKTMFHWSPVREQDGMVVSEWEGGELDTAGFLKQDILGIKQLDKYQNIIESIQKVEGKYVDIYNVPLNDKKVYEYFKKGWNGDVFHFGSKGLTQYCKELQPENIEDLIAGISLYRPGAMENGFHNDYVRRKHGEESVSYYTGTENILNKTYAVFCYQEQVMQIFQQLGGLSLVEADDVRKAMGKKKYDILHSFKDRFISNYSDKYKVSEEYANTVWNAIEKASTYLFNRSHAAAYAITGYIGQWLKVHYPIHFWSTALNYANEDIIPNFISEINLSGDIKILPPDINKSYTNIYTDFNTNTIYWALSSIKQCGEIATDQIIKEREENGDYFSFPEFIERHSFKDSKVNKRVLEHLILSGAFDEIENIKFPQDRIILINNLRSLKGVKINEDNDIFNNKNINSDWWWSLQQRRLSGIAFFDYKRLSDDLMDKPYYDTIEFNEERSQGNQASIGGYVVEITEGETRKGKFARIVLESNYSFLDVIIWPEQYERFGKDIEDIKKSILFITGTIQYDSRNKHNVLHSMNFSDIKVLK